MQKKKLAAAKIIERVTDRGFGIFFLWIVVTSAVFVMHFISDYTPYAFPLTLMLVCCAAAGSFGIDNIERFLKNKFGESKKVYAQIFTGAFLLLVASQCAFAAAFDFEPKNDLSYVCKAAENLVTLGVSHLHDGLPERHAQYFATYPNNHLLLLIVAALYKLQFSLTGRVSNFLPTVVNILSLDVSFLLMYKCAKIIYPPSKAAVCALRGLMFTPLVTYSLFFYTDSMATPWVTGALYIYLKYRYISRKGSSPKRSLPALCACGVVLAAAYKIKGSAVILLPAILLDILLGGKATVARRKILPALGISAVFLITAQLIGLLSMNLLGISKAELDRCKFPPVHWVMMSADGDGGYQYTDFEYTKKFAGVSEKTSADIKRLREKISEQGVGGFCEHLNTKISRTWADGTYMANYYYSRPKFFLNHAYLSAVMLLHFILLIKMARTFFVKNSGGGELSQNFILKITLVGVTAFFILWESKSRYLVSFFFLFALL